MKKESYECDFCGEEVWGQGKNATVVILSLHNIIKYTRMLIYTYTHSKGCQRDYFDSTLSKFDESYFKHKQINVYEVCEDCIGEKININHGDDAYFAVGGFKKFLINIGFIKKKEPQNG